MMITNMVTAQNLWKCFQT